MQPVLRELMVWIAQFVCVSVCVLAAVHILMRSVRKQRREAEERSQRSGVGS